MKLRCTKPLIFVAIVMAAASAHAQATRSAPSAQLHSITVISQPGAVVWIDGVKFGKTDKAGRLDIKTVSGGTHTLRVRADGFKEKSQPLTAAQKGEIRVDLVKTTDDAELAFQEAERL